jgi:hypothetical protein
MSTHEEIARAAEVAALKEARVRVVSSGRDTVLTINAMIAEREGRGEMSAPKPEPIRKRKAHRKACLRTHSIATDIQTRRVTLPWNVVRLPKPDWYRCTECGKEFELAR